MSQTSDTSYAYVARNTALSSANKIHSDEEAQRYGFRGALVPGSCTVAHALNPVMERFGPGWFEGGTALVRLPTPVYTGERVEVELTEPEPGRVDIASSVGAERRSDGHAVAPGVGGLRTMVEPRPFPLVDPPAEAVPIDEDRYLADEWMGSVTIPTDADTLAAFAAGIDLPEGLPGRLGLVHPGYIARTYVDIMNANVRRTGPSVHTSEHLTVFRPTPVGEPLSLRGRVERLFGRRGNRYWILDLAWYDTAENLVMRSEHAAIYRLRER